MEIFVENASFYSVRKAQKKTVFVWLLVIFRRNFTNFSVPVNDKFPRQRIFQYFHKFTNLHHKCGNNVCCALKHCFHSFNFTKSTALPKYHSYSNTFLNKGIDMKWYSWTVSSRLLKASYPQIVLKQLFSTVLFGHWQFQIISFANSVIYISSYLWKLQASFCSSMTKIENI